MKVQNAHEHSAYYVTIPKRDIDAIDLPEGFAKIILGSISRRIWSFRPEGSIYTFSRWEPVLYDAMVVAATVEFADKSVRRPRAAGARH